MSLNSSARSVQHTPKGTELHTTREEGATGSSRKHREPKVFSSWENQPIYILMVEPIVAHYCPYDLIKFSCVVAKSHIVVLATFFTTFASFKLKNHKLNAEITTHHAHTLSYSLSLSVRTLSLSLPVDIVPISSSVL